MANRPGCFRRTLAGGSSSLTPQRAYQASLLREEGRSVICRLILIDPAELNDSEGPPAGLQVLQLKEERKLRENEIRRLGYRGLTGWKCALRQKPKWKGHILGCPVLLGLFSGEAETKR